MLVSMFRKYNEMYRDRWLNQLFPNSISLDGRIFFDMIKDKDTERNRVDLSVLKGLVTVNGDKVKQADGSSSGPLSVSVFGIPVYSGNYRSSPKSQLKSELKSSDNSALENLIASQAAANERALTTIRKNSERVTQQFNEMLGKLVSFWRPSSVPIEFTPADKQIDSAAGSMVVSDVERAQKVKST